MKKQVIKCQGEYCSHRTKQNTCIADPLIIGKLDKSDLTCLFCERFTKLNYNSLVDPNNNKSLQNAKDYCKMQKILFSAIKKNFFSE